MLDFFALPEVAESVSTKCPAGVSALNTVPVCSRKNIYLHPWHLDMSEDAKYGASGKWPSNVQIRAHFSSVVQQTYQGEREALDIKFPLDLHGSGKPLPMFSVQFTDGHCKAIMVLAIFALLEHMVP